VTPQSTLLEQETAQRATPLLQRARRSGSKFINPVPTSVGKPSTMLKAAWRFFTAKGEREPAKQLGPFVTDTKAFERAPADGLRVTWMGHSTLLVEIDGMRVLIDPVWSKRASFSEIAGPQRFYPPTLKLGDLPKIDVVLISHDHYDHLDPSALGELDAWQPGLQYVTSLGVGKYLRKAQVPANLIHELDWTESFRIGELELTAVPSRHFSGRSLFNRFETLWSSFVLRGPQHKVYFGADSGWWDGFAEIGAAYGPFDLTMLEIGAFDPLWHEIHLGPDKALEAFHALNPAGGLFLPIHWGLFNLALHAWRQPVERLLEIAGDTPLLLPVPGVPVDVDGAMNSFWWQG
jgi:L-ascorbate metabolism protein UlaG (beta-lactamase superfamily)